MNSTYTKQFQIIKKYLKIKKILSIRFSNTKTSNYKKYKDTACTALVRSFRNNALTYIDRKNGQLCPGGNYFLDIIHSPKKDILNTYVDKEKIFQNSSICNTFINNLPKYPTVARRGYVLITPLPKERNKPDVVMLLANPAQAGRILGLSVFRKMSYPLVVPALSTCASIYAPIESKKIHLNFIDYYDRYYQGKQIGQSLWKDSNLIISMRFDEFENIIRHIPLSAHGSYKPDIEPQNFDEV